MISSGPGQRHREYYRTTRREGRGSSPTAFSPGLSSRLLGSGFCQQQRWEAGLGGA